MSCLYFCVLLHVLYDLWSPTVMIVLIEFTFEYVNVVVVNYCTLEYYCALFYTILESIFIGLLHAISHVIELFLSSIVL